VTSLCQVAIDAIATAFTHGVRRPPSLHGLDARLRAPGASFVTLERDDALLGCVGALVARQPLAVDVAEHALQAAFDDPRLPPLCVDDYAVMSVKVSVLSPPEAIAAVSFDELVDAVRPGIDGVTIEAGIHRATLLPSVWPKVRDRDEFFDVLWQKAGLTPGCWPEGISASRYSTTEECDAGPRAALAVMPHSAR
jgi:AmmeMemoRadiSam system protein A